MEELQEKSRNGCQLCAMLYEAALDADLPSTGYVCFQRIESRIRLKESLSDAVRLLRNPGNSSAILL
jgi:hypothetical protein